jgi:hypothetical protein
MSEIWWWHKIVVCFRMYNNMMTVREHILQKSPRLFLRETTSLEDSMASFQYHPSVGNIYLPLVGQQAMLVDPHNGIPLFRN